MQDSYSIQFKLNLGYLFIFVVFNWLFLFEIEHFLIEKKIKLKSLFVITGIWFVITEKQDVENIEIQPKT